MSPEKTETPAVNVVAIMEELKSLRERVAAQDVKIAERAAPTVTKYDAKLPAMAQAKIDEFLNADPAVPNPFSNFLFSREKTFGVELVPEFRKYDPHGQLVEQTAPIEIYMQPWYGPGIEIPLEGRPNMGKFNWGFFDLATHPMIGKPFKGAPLTVEMLWHYIRGNPAKLIQPWPGFCNASCDFFDLRVAQMILKPEYAKLKLLAEMRKETQAGLAQMGSLGQMLSGAVMPQVPASVGA
jgi:hypothetical protein